ncbi:MAG TPA: zinc ribbon domain-containing protein [bacterium]|nr:zinc ribbon domain-containing protein [bacterium]
MGQIECQSCGRSISSDSTACKYCGEPVKSAQVVESTLSNTVTCPGCGQTVKAGLEVCPHCGFERKVARKKTPLKTKPEKAPPQVIVPRKKAAVEAPPAAKVAPPPAAKAVPPPVASVAPPPEVHATEPNVAPPGKSEPATSTREPRTRTPEPPTKIDQERIDATRHTSATTELPPPPPGLDSDYLPERPEGLISSKIHVFLRGLQLGVKPMDYPALITNIRSHKVKLNDFIYDEAWKSWRTIADMFNLPEME